MLTLMEGGLYSRTAEDMRTRIRTLVEAEAARAGESDAGPRIFLIVPEQQTVTAEREMADVLPPSAALHFEVTNFTRLANTVFRRYGGLGTEHPDPGRCALLMWRALTELSPVLETVGRTVSAGAVDRVCAAVKEMGGLGIAAEELSRAAQDERIAQDRRLLAKVRDLSSVMSMYRVLLGERYSEVGDDIPLLTQKLKEHPEALRGVYIFLDGFTSFTESQYEVLYELLGRAEVTAALTLPKWGADAFEYREIREAERRLLSLADRRNCPKTVRKADGASRAGNGILPAMLPLLWRPEGTLDPGEYENRGAVRIVEADTPYGECDFIAQDIRRRVMAGARYADFAVVARCADDYRGMLPPAFEKAGVPLFFDRRRDIASFEAIKLIYAAYAAVLGDFRGADVISYAKCGLSGIRREECDLLEMYVEKWQINGRRFTDGEVWNMNPAGYTDRRAAGDEELLLQLDGIRTRLLTPLIAFGESVRGEHTVIEHATALVRFLSLLDLEAGLAARAEELEAIGEGESAEENRGLWKQICDALDCAVEVLGDLTVDGDTFLSVLKILFSVLDTGRIPARRDEVTAGSADMLRLYNKKHLYLLGVNYGKFPATVGENSYFTDTDKARLAALGLAVTPDLTTRGARELFIFSRAVAAASDSVTLMYAARDAAMRKIAPADVIGRIREILGDRIQTERVEDMPLARRVYSAEYGMESLGGSAAEQARPLRQALAEAGYADRVAAAGGRIANDTLTLTKQGTDLLFCREDLVLSQSRIEQYVSCPLSYFLRFQMGIADPAPAAFGMQNVGTFIHAVVEDVFREIQRQKIAPDGMPEEERERIVERVAENFVSELSGGNLKKSARSLHLIRRLCQSAMPVVDGLCDEFSHSLYQPVFFELPIRGEGGEESAAPTQFMLEDGTRVYIRGVIDRVDAYKSGRDVYVRIADYKTGEKKLSKEDIDRGQNLQLFLYLKSVMETQNEAFRRRLGVEEGGKIYPAGVIYVHASIDDARAKSETEAKEAALSGQKRIGLLLYDKESLAAMNPKYLPIAFRRDGELHRSSVQKVFTLEEFDDMNARIAKSVKEIARQMKGGNISARPLFSGAKFARCQYCPYKVFCRGEFH